MSKGFFCEHCGKYVSRDSFIGTAFRNHCPFCLWSKHHGQGKTIDKVRPCQAIMEPIGLTFKHEGFDKFTGKPKQGELMVLHQCLGCGEMSINRIAGDDKPDEILKLLNRSPIANRGFDISVRRTAIRSGMTKNSIKILDDKDEKEIKRQLFGK